MSAANSLQQVLTLVRETKEQLSRVGAPLLAGEDAEARAAIEQVGYAEAMGVLKGLVDVAIEVLDRIQDLREVPSKHSPDVR